MNAEDIEELRGQREGKGVRNRQRERNYALCPGDDDVRHTRWRDWERRLVMEHDIPDREISRMTGRSVRAIQVMRHKMRKNGEVRTDE